MGDGRGRSDWSVCDDADALNSKRFPPICGSCFILLGPRYGLVPIADLLNHDGGRRSTWHKEYTDSVRKDDPTAFVFAANRDTAKGGEIMISYGDHQSSYNFFMCENKNTRPLSKTPKHITGCLKTRT